MRNLKLYIIIILIALSCFPLSARHFARWWTSMGTFTSDLRDEIVPITANNFINLTNSGFYNGLHFHRVVEGFVIQDGDPLGTGYGGPGYTIQDEFSPLLHHDSAGVLAMAHSSLPNSAGSQYYITLAPTPHLDGSYAIFGKVFEGLDVVLDIGQVPVDANDHPVTNVYIDSLKILDLIIFNVSPPTDSLVYYNLELPSSFVVEAFNSDMSVQISWYIDDVLQPNATDIIYQPEFPNYGLHTLKCVTSTDDVTWTTEWQVYVFQGGASEDFHSPHIPDISIVSIYPNPFSINTRVDFKLEKAATVRIGIYDIKGRLVNEQELLYKAGLNQWLWNGKDTTGQPIASGIYFIKVNTASAQSVQKMVFLK